VGHCHKVADQCSKKWYIVHKLVRATLYS
jgi:hypothetical protein